MAIPTFFHPQLQASATQINLSAAEAQHARAARRLGLGQKVRLLNGLGLVALGEISVLERRTVGVDIGSTTQVPRQEPSINVFTAIPKGDRQRTLVEGLTQLGVAAITPLACEYSSNHGSPKLIEKWQRYAIEASKQSQNAWLPEITQCQSLGTAITAVNSLESWFADSSGGYLGRSITTSVGAPASKRYNLFIGPEGGFSPLELELFQDIEMPPLRLAGNVLRTEVAAISGVAQLVAHLAF